TRAFGPPPPPGASDRGIGLAGLAAVGSKVFFSQGAGLWMSDGTPAGTRQVPGSTLSGSGSDPHDLLAVGARLFFAACDGSISNLWTNLGTAASTVPVTHLPTDGPRCLTL